MFEEEILTRVIQVPDKIRKWGSIPHFLILYKILDNLHTGCIFSLQLFSFNDNQYLISGGADKSIKLWNINDNFNISYSLENHKDRVRCLSSFEKDGKQFIISGSNDKSIKLWRYEEGVFNAYTYNEHKDYVVSLSTFFSNKGLIIISLSNDKVLKLWN